MKILCDCDLILRQAAEYGIPYSGESQIEDIVNQIESWETLLSIAFDNNVNWKHDHYDEEALTEALQEKSERDEAEYRDYKNQVRDDYYSNLGV